MARTAFAALSATPAERIASRFVPAGARKITHRATGAVAYVYGDDAGRPSVRAFMPKAAKPVFSFYYRTVAQRDAKVAEWFKGLEATAAYKAQRKAEAKAAGNKLEVGDVLSASWGYEQTNVDYYQVVARTAATVTVRKIKATSVDAREWAQGECAPLLNSFCGEALTKRVVNGDAVRIASYIYASREAYTEVAGVRVYRSRHWTAYA